MQSEVFELWPILTEKSEAELLLDMMAFKFLDWQVLVELSTHAPHMAQPYTMMQQQRPLFPRARAVFTKSVSTKASVRFGF